MMSTDCGKVDGSPHRTCYSYAPVARKFYDLENGGEESEVIHENDTHHDKSRSLLEYVKNNVIGRNKEFSGPFGRRKVEYCDYTASGRSLEFIEEYIRDEVLPSYGNTHTTTSITSLQTTLFRHEARDLVRNAVNASEHDCVLFIGSGCTGAVHKLLHTMDLQLAPVVFVGPFEHHSNLLPWRETGCEVIRIRETPDGQVDQEHLEQVLQKHSSCGRQLIGSFCAASNITGTLTDVDSVTSILHSHGALAFWDYATAAPYVNVNMNPVLDNVNPDLVAKDAVFISPHKFVGGVQTTGVLIAKKKLFKNQSPDVSGGGSVFFVRREAHRYLQQPEMREEAGTPAIVESVRTGLVFQLKQAVGAALIMEREEALVRGALECWRDIPSLMILGSQSAPRLAVFSLVIQHPATGLHLHHNYVSALLNDLFGIQARGGCACAGPYAQDLLGISEDLAAKYEALLVENSQLDRVHLRRYTEYSHREILRPGFVRLNLPYFLDDDTVNFILEAVKMVALDGWKLLPQYNFNPETGEWRHRQHQIFRDRSWLGHISYRSGCMEHKPPDRHKETAACPSPQDCLTAARATLDTADRVKVTLPDQTVMFDSEAADYRWFMLPSEALHVLKKGKAAGNLRQKPPFNPVVYPRTPVQTLEPSSTFNTIPAENKSLTGIDTSELPELVTCQGPASEQGRDSFQEGMTQVWSRGLTGQLSQSELGTSDLCQGADRETPDTVDSEQSSYTEQAMSLKANPLPDKKAVRNSKPHELQDKDAIFYRANQNSEEVSWCAEKPANDNSVQSERRQGRQQDDRSDRRTVPLHCTANQEPAKEQCTLERIRQHPKLVQSEAGAHKWHSPPKVIFKPFVEAVEEFEMIRHGDRVLACLSGGKDSLSLLHTLRQYQFYAKKKGIEFELGAVTIDPQTDSYDPSPLKLYLQQLSVPYFYEEQCIMDAAQNLPYECASICSFCSRMKRGRIYHAARREKYNVLAMGQHLDDLAESFMMSVFQNGVLRTMKACYTVQEGDLRVIRPFVYVRETELRRFAEQNKLPIIAENCPACFETPKERHRMKQLLASQEIIHPRLFPSILSAIKPIFSINKTGVNVRELLLHHTEGVDEDA